VITDLVVDTLDEDVLESVLQALGQGELIRDSKDPEEPFLTKEGFLVVRLKNVPDVPAFAREVQRRVMNLRVVGSYDRTPKEGK
jgi:hypothetical protein